MNTKTRTARIALVTVALAAVLTTASCAAGSATATPTGGTSAPVATSTAVATDSTPAPVASSAAPVAAAPARAVTADAYSQVINGKLFQGTELAPVRIGTDTPGQAPAGEAAFLAAGRTGSMDRAAKSGKFLVYVFHDTKGRWAWKTFGLDQWNNFEEIGSNGYREGIYLPSRAAALAGPFKADGRVLDRAEFFLFAES